MNSLLLRSVLKPDWPTHCQPGH